MKECKCDEENNGWELAEGETIPAVCTDYTQNETYDDPVCFWCGHVEACHPQPIKMWRWGDAPERYRALSIAQRGVPANSDLVVFVPVSGARPDMGWLDDLGSDVYEFTAMDGTLFYIPGRRP